jgi:predicted Zn-dependent peptidase
MKHAWPFLLWIAGCGAAPSVTPDAPFRAAAPAVAPPPPLVFPALHEKQLANGLRVRFVVDKRLPLAELALVAPPHPANRRERAADGALFALVAEALAADGAPLGLSVSSSSRALRANVAGALAAQAMDLLAELVISKRFSEADLNRYKRSARSDELTASVAPHAIARYAIAGILPPNGAWSADYLPASELTLNDVEAARRRLLRPAGALLVVAGSVEEEKWVTFLEKRIGNWQGPGAPPPQEPPDFWHQRTAKILLVDDGSLEPALLTPVAVFAPGVTFDDPDRAALELLSATLATGPASRLFQHLRSEQAATYGAYGVFRAGHLPSPIVIGASVRSGELVASLTTIFQEIERLRMVEISDVERAGSVEAMNNEELANLASLSGQVSAAVEDWQLGVPNSQASRAGARRLVTPAALRAAAARYLAPEQLRVVVVGSAKLVPALESAKLGEVTVMNPYDFNMAQASTFNLPPRRSARPPEEIQKVVRDHFGVFRRCYENGLRTNPRLQGRISTHFVIEADGRVSAAEFVSTEDRLNDKAVQECVVAGFLTLPFGTAPGKVTVTYPIIFNPGD